jgi:hypothetical protein
MLGFMKDPAIDIRDDLAGVLPGCFVAALFVSAWHFIGAFGSLAEWQEPVARGGQVVSYSAHAFLMFSVGLGCRARLIGNPGGLRSTGYLRWLGNIAVMYWIALLAFVLLGIVDRSQMVLGIVLGNVIVAKDLLSLWFVQVMVLFLVLAPILVVPNLTHRIAGVALAFGGLFALKVMFKWVDIRIFELFPIFAAGFAIGEFRWIRKLLGSNAMLLMSVLMIPLCAWSYDRWYDSTAITTASRVTAMGAGVVMFWRLSMALSARRAGPVIAKAGASWLGVILLHRVVQWGSGASHLDLGTSGSLFVLIAVLLPVTFIISMGYCRLFKIDRGMGLGTAVEN